MRDSFEVADQFFLLLAVNGRLAKITFFRASTFTIWQVNSMHCSSTLNIVTMGNHDQTSEKIPFISILTRFFTHTFFYILFSFSSLSTNFPENMKFLTVEQSLADLAYLITALKHNPHMNATGGVILVGGSYAGAMTTWFRQKYPHIANGGWASSAPLLAKLDFGEYKEVVSSAIHNVGGQQCYTRLFTVFQKINNLISSGQIERLRGLFHLCRSFTGKNKYDVWNLLNTLSDSISNVVQNHKRGDIENACREILQETPASRSDKVTGDMHGFARFFMRKYGLQEGKCIDAVYQSSFRSLINDAFGGGTARQWIYQTCSQFGWYQTSSSKQQVFGQALPIEFYVRLCSDLFGPM